MSKLQKASRTITGTIIRVMIYILIVAIVFLFAQRSFALGRKVFSEQGVEEAPGTNLTVTIMPDDSTLDVANKLKEVGLIEDKLVFFVQAFCFELEVSEENAGTYVLNTSQSAEDMIRQITDGIFNPIEEIPSQ